MSYSLGLRYADDVTIDCWWRHNNETIVTRSRQWWYLIRSLDIDFIHGDIHGRAKNQEMYLLNNPEEYKRMWKSKPRESIHVEI